MIAVGWDRYLAVGVFLPLLDLAGDWEVAESPMPGLDISEIVQEGTGLLVSLSGCVWELVAVCSRWTSRAGAASKSGLPGLLFGLFTLRWVLIGGCAVEGARDSDMGAPICDCDEVSEAPMQKISIGLRVIFRKSFRKSKRATNQGV